MQKSKNLNVEELETLKNVRSKHANDKKQEYDKLKSDIDNVKKAKKERAARLEKESNANIDNLKKDHAIKVKINNIVTTIKKPLFYHRKPI